MENKLQEVAATYRKMIENKMKVADVYHDYAMLNKSSSTPSNIHNRYKGQILANEVEIGGKTTPRDYSWLLEDMLKEESLEDLQKYHFGKEKW